MDSDSEIRKPDDSIRTSKRGKLNESSAFRPDVTTKRRKTGALLGSNVNVSVLSDNLGILDTVVYRPQSQLTSGVYKELLSLLQTVLPDETSEALYEAAHEVISIFKADQLDTVRRSQICECLGGVSVVSEDLFASLYRLGLLITDFAPKKLTDESTNEEGIAITFDEEDDDEEQDIISDVSSSVDEEPKFEPVEAPKRVWSDSWLSDELVMLFPDSFAFYEKQVMELVNAHIAVSPLALENALVELFNFDHIDLLKQIVASRFRLWVLVNDPKGLLEFNDSLALELYKELSSGDLLPQPSTLLDLSNLCFPQGGRLMSNSSFNPATKTFQVSKKNYDEVHVQAPEKAVIESRDLVDIHSVIPSWGQAAFAGFDRLNPVQSKVFPIAFHEFYENMLVCAPTGAGKTNIAMLTILNVVSQFVFSDGRIDLSQFKVVYIAPMKALVQEVVKSFSLRLNPLGIAVAELSGDANISREEMGSTQVIVTTPEKWDVVTRKGNVGFTKLVKLIIIDEVHLLHDSRGPVLEAIVARTVRQIEQTQENVRLVALSATLPNFRDVAIFLRVNLDKGLFYFGAEYRPVPLEQTYIGIKTKKALKRGQVINEVVFEKVMEEVGQNQILVFVHGRKETARTAKELVRLAQEKKEAEKFLSPNSKGVLEHESKNMAKSADVKSLLPFGIGIHHAGLPSEDRSLVEDLFAARHLSVCVCTLTLAWGVNLPAHTVIIKGTQIYQPERGEWVELSPMDMMQMMGRAGRPQYDVTGHGIVITNQAELQYYLSLNNMQLPIESQLISVLPDLVNAEIALGSIGKRDDVVRWLGYTYLHVRMLQNPTLYGVDPQVEDEKLVQRRVDLAHAALTALDKNGLAKYDRKSGLVQITALGRVASYFYLRHESVANYSANLKPNLTDIDILRVFAQSAEFKFISVREEEKVELSKLVELVPIPVKGGSEDNASKINVLLQAFVSRLSLDGFALMADMVFVTQNAGRLFRALFEIALKRGWSALSQKLLVWCKIVELRMWPIQTPLRHFRSVPDEVCCRIERKGLTDLSELSGEELGDLVRNQKLGGQLHRFLGQIPKFKLTAYVQPISQSCLQMKCEIEPDYEFNSSVHAGLEYFWLIVEDVTQQFALYSDQFALSKSQVEAKSLVTLAFTVPVTDPVPPYYFVRVVSDRWMGVCTLRAVSFRHLILPPKSAPPTELLDLEPLVLPSELACVASGPQGPVVTQTFEAMYNSDEPVLLAAPIGSGKRICSQIAISRVLQFAKKKCIFVTPKTIDDISEWVFPHNCRVAEFCGSLDTMESSDVIVTNVSDWDAFSRKWKTKRIGEIFKNIALVVFEDLHLVGELGLFEVAASRTRFIAASLKSLRIIGLSVSAANASDLANWIGAKTVFNFSPATVPLELVIHGFDVFNRSARHAAMLRPLYTNIVNRTKKGDKILVVATDMQQAKIAAADLVLQTLADGEPDRFGGVADSANKCLQHGVGCGEADKELFVSGRIRVLFVTSKQISSNNSLKADMVVILDTCVWEKHQWVDYRATDVLAMIGLARRKCVLLLANSKREFYKKFISEPIVVESGLDEELLELLNTEIVSGAVKSKQDCIDWFTWTFYYRRIVKNPNYYSLIGTSAAEISDFLSTLIDEAVEQLELAGMINTQDAAEDTVLTATDLGLIASYYGAKIGTIAQFRRLITRSCRRKNLVEILASALEFEYLDVPPVDLRVCAAAKLDPATTSPLVCALWGHFLRVQTLDIVPVAHRLVCALVDVISTCGWLKAALTAMELGPMLKQGLVSNPLLQIPYFDEQRCNRALTEYQVEDVFDLLAMEHTQRSELLADLTAEQVSLVAHACNAFPSMEMSAVQNGEEITVELVPSEEQSGWWLVLGKDDELIDIKRVTDQKRVRLLNNGQTNLKLVLMNDSFMGCDQEEAL